MILLSLAFVLGAACSYAGQLALARWQFHRRTKRLVKAAGEPGETQSRQFRRAAARQLASRVFRRNHTQEVRVKEKRPA